MSKEPVILALPESVLAELDQLRTEGRVVLSPGTREALGDGMSKIIPRDRAVELRIVKDDALPRLRAVRDAASGGQPLSAEDQAVLRQLREE